MRSRIPLLLWAPITGIALIVGINVAVQIMTGIALR